MQAVYISLHRHPACGRQSRHDLQHQIFIGRRFLRSRILRRRIYALTFPLRTAYTVHRNIGSCGVVIPAPSGLIVKVKRESGVFFYGNNIVKILLPVRCVPNHKLCIERFVARPTLFCSAAVRAAAAAAYFVSSTAMLPRLPTVSLHTPASFSTSAISRIAK